jgi:DNA-binding transcriptional MerR regulator/methylmalonyl-CoA mutase cobalamin-binding subunit
MNNIENAETYNLGVVVNETGINPDTLRAWERRYGVPSPGRTEGGHRLYSERDIDTVKWLLERQDEGMRIGRAVELWETIKETGRDPLLERPLKSAPTRAFQPSYQTRPLAGSSLDEIQENWLEAALAFEEDRADQIIVQALALYPLELVCVEVLQRSLAQVGVLWHENEINPHQEHFVSSLAIRRIDALIAASPTPTRSERIVVGAPTQEQHVFSSLVTTLFLRRRGYDVVYLGANVPVAEFERSIKVIEPDLVILTAMRLDTAASLLDMSDFLRGQEVLFAFGGWIFTQIPDLHQQVPGVYLGQDFLTLPAKVQDLLSRGGEILQDASQDPPYQALLEALEARELLVKNAVLEAYAEKNIPQNYVRLANTHFTNSMQAALKLGEIQYMDHELQWLKGLLKKRGFTDEEYRKYMRIYHQSLQAVMDGNLLEPLDDWFESYLE